MQPPKGPTGAHASTFPTATATPKRNNKVDDLGLKVATCIPIVGIFIPTYVACNSMSQKVLAAGRDESRQIKVVEHYNHFIIASIVQEILTAAIMGYLAYEGLLDTTTAAACGGLVVAIALYNGYKIYGNSQVIEKLNQEGAQSPADLASSLYL